MYQKLTIVGNLGSDPEMRYTPSGQAVCNYNVATNRVWYNNNGEKQEETVWFRVSTWGKRAESDNQYLHKGDKVLVEGRLRPPQAWQGQDGEWRASLEVTALEVKYLSARGESGVSGGDAPGAADDASMTEDEIPF